MILFLYGNDNFRSWGKAVAIKNKFLRKDKIGSGLSIVDFEENNERIKLSEIAGVQGLFSSKRLVVIKNLILSGTSGDQQEVLDFLKTGAKNIQASQDTVLVFWEKELPRKNNKLFKFLLANSKNQNFEKLSGGKLSAWALKRIQNLGGKISQPALNKLIIYVGNDLLQMNNEIEKLTSYVSCSKYHVASIKGKNIENQLLKERQIQEQDVNLLVKSKIEANIFETIDALASRNKKIALKLLHDQLEKGDDPFYIFSMYVYQFRNLLKIGGFYFQGNTNQYEIAKAAKLHPFVAQKGIAQLRGFTLIQLKKIYKRLGELDLQIKTGKIDIVLALDRFVVSI